MIGALTERYSLKELLKYLSIPKSSYFYHQAALSIPDKNREIRERVRTAFELSKSRYGYRRIHAVLTKDGGTVSEKVIRRLMHEESLVALGCKRRKYNSYKGEIGPPVPNIIERDFHADLPNTKWLTDITEFPLPAGKVYLSPIIDCFDGMAVSWSIRTAPNADMVNYMLDKAIKTLGNDERPVVHSDRGNQYRCPVIPLVESSTCCTTYSSIIKILMWPQAMRGRVGGDWPQRAGVWWKAGAKPFRISPLSR